MSSTPVQKELGRIAADYRRFLVLKYLTYCWAGTAALGLILFALYKSFGFSIPRANPALLVLAFVAAVFAYFRASRQAPSLRDIARLVERDDPRLNTLLLAAVEQVPDLETGQLNYLQMRVIREAVEANRRSPWNQKFTQRLFFVQGVHLATLGLVALAVFMLFVVAPKTTAVAAASTSVQITPGDASLEKGTEVAIVAQLQRASETDVRLVYVTPENGERSVVMSRSLSDPLYGYTLPSVDVDTRYYVEYNGARSPEFKLSVFEYPELKRADAELTYPQYTGMSAAKIEDTRRVSAVEGTDVSYSFYLNKLVKTARLLGTNDSVMVLTNIATRGKGPTNSVAYELQFPLEESGRYKLELVDESGRTNKLPTDFVFVALRNEAPKLKLNSPRGDQRVSALQEVHFDAETQDDFGVFAYGVAYSLPGRETEMVELTSKEAKTLGKPHQKQTFTWTLPIEHIKAEVGELVSYYLWADDMGPDGIIRRSPSDMYFAEIRPFEEIFREGASDSSSSEQGQQGQGQNNPATKLMELQKEIVTATWNLQRRENKSKASPKFQEDAAVVRDSQQSAIEQAEGLKDQVRDEKSKALADEVLTAMESAEKKLSEVVNDKAVAVLPSALDSEQRAYQALLKLQAREYQVSRSRSRNSRGSGSGQQRAQQQLDQLEMKEDENRYETQSQASALQTPEQRESLQVLNRLKELARRQQDMSERLKELQTALNEAKSKEEREELQRQLKRLQEEQQQIVQDMDEVRQRMAQPENQSRMADAREQLDQSREQSREAARQLEAQNLSQALSSSSRAEQQLEKLSDEFRKATSSQFAEEMRQMRQETRQIEQRQENITRKMEEMRDTRQRSLSEDGPRKEALEALAQQRTAVTNILQQIRQVTEQAETAEPLLSRQLYETFRRSAQGNPEKALELSAQLLERNFLPQSLEAQKNSNETIRQLAEGVENAARSVLGDEAEALRFAQRELQDLANRAEREMLGETGGAIHKQRFWCERGIAQ